MNQKQIETAAARIEDEALREWFLERMETADQMIASGWDRRREAWRKWREWTGQPPKARPR